MNSMSLAENKNQNISIWESQSDLKQIKEIYGKDLSSGEFNTLVQMGKATGLNPFLREIWAVKYGNTPAQIFIGRDGYRKSAQRSPFYDYHVSDAVYSEDEFHVVDGEIKHKYNLKNRGDLVGAYCIVKRKGSSRPSYVFVELREYSTGKSLWNGKPSTMIKKVAEAQGLKAGFQELFAGTYSEYEMWDQNENVSNKQGKGVQGLKEKLGLVEPKDQGNKIDEDVFLEAEFNTLTGEIIDEPKKNDEIKPTFDTIEFLMDSASTVKELMDAMKLAKDFSTEDKKKVSELFNLKRAEIQG